MSESADLESEEPQDGAAYFGQEVRYARAFAGMTQQELADASHYKRPYVTKVEGGTLLASVKFAEACDRVFNTPGVFARLRRRVSERGHPGWFIPYIKLEREATSVADYSTTFIMGMFQTAAYAEAVFRAMHPRADDGRIEGWVEARLRRREVMEREKPPLLWVILHEGALRTVVGSGSTMAGQLDHLTAQTESPHIMIQVLPFRAGAPASHLPFNLLTQGDGTVVMYSETLGQGRVTDSATIVSSAQASYERLRASALSPEDSSAFIRKIKKEYVT
ncbi:MULTISPECIES: Scr1 family TA system antitoxin-like transcriptional regulator [unclassified Streptomyces]|uniref:helix-turn-helix domain-containing protein n=1 Tax=unclassified Streptomyces TaxID=2593676 RepID=UPI00381D89C6